MAQSTAGIKLYANEATVTEGSPVYPTDGWDAIPDITGIPAMNATPNQLQTTTLDELVQHTYIAGLQDLGGSFEFSANLTPGLIDAVDEYTGDPAPGKVWAFKLSFPAPLSISYWWTGSIQPVRPGEGGVDAVATTTVYISQETSIKVVEEESVS